MISPPEFAQSFAEFRVMEVGVLVRELSACRLCPDHEGVHGSLHVRLVFTGAVHADRHGHEGPVVPLEHLGHRVADAHRELAVVFVLLAAVRSQQAVLRRARVLGVGAGSGGARGPTGVLRHARARRPGEAFLLVVSHLQVGVQEIHANNFMEQIRAEVFKNTQRVFGSRLDGVRYASGRARWRSLRVWTRSCKVEPVFGRHG